MDASERRPEPQPSPAQSGSASIPGSTHAGSRRRFPFIPRPSACRRRRAESDRPGSGGGYSSGWPSAVRRHRWGCRREVRASPRARKPIDGRHVPGRDRLPRHPALASLRPRPGVLPHTTTKDQIRSGVSSWLDAKMARGEAGGWSAAPTGWARRNGRVRPSMPVAVLVWLPAPLHRSAGKRPFREWRPVGSRRDRARYHGARAATSADAGRAYRRVARRCRPRGPGRHGCPARRRNRDRR